MSEKQPFFFDQFVPGFEFLKNLANGASTGGAGAPAAKAGLPGMPGIPGIPGISSWVAPTLSVEEVDKRIQELKAVQFWLDQNLHALKATIQALEVQRMTLSTLQGMNLRMEDLAKAFTGGASVGGGKPRAPESEPAREKAKPSEDAYGRLGVLAGWRTDAKIAFNVARNAFTPPPKVTSAVVHLAPKPVDPSLPVRKLEAVTRAAFGQRRKMVRQSLRATGAPVETLLAAADLRGDERAEVLAIEAYLEMAKAL